MNNITVGNEEYKLGELVDDEEIDQDKVKSRFSPYSWTPVDNGQLSKEIKDAIEKLRSGKPKRASYKSLKVILSVSFGIWCSVFFISSFGWLAGFAVGSIVLAYGIQKALAV